MKNLNVQKVKEEALKTEKIYSICCVCRGCYAQETKNKEERRRCFQHKELSTKIIRDFLCILNKNCRYTQCEKCMVKQMKKYRREKNEPT